MDAKFEGGREPAAASSRQDKLARVHALLGDGAALAPATAAQERFWVLAHAGEDASFYHVAEAVEVVGDLDYDRLERCLGSLIERHETLRTGIATLQGKPIQIILPRVRAPLVRLSPVAGRSVEATLREWAVQPFDLARAPLWRMAVMPVASGQHAVLAVFHHLISDGWSLAVFCGKFCCSTRPSSTVYARNLRRPCNIESTGRSRPKHSVAFGKRLSSTTGRRRCGTSRNRPRCRSTLFVPRTARCQALGCPSISERVVSRAHGSSRAPAKRLCLASSWRCSMPCFTRFRATAICSWAPSSRADTGAANGKPCLAR